jgi:CheY-like chemotaxis protein/anti-sigma regulatory factor (Ser/Thr protein kinase)
VGFVLADATQMHQILLNLCSNAEHAMRYTGGVLHVRLQNVEIDVQRATAEANLAVGSYVQLTVQDTGHGMPPDVKERIFDPYFTTKGPGEGTGMGLTVVHGIVANHSGVIAVSSTVGQGTTFTLYLPRIEAMAAATSSPPDPLLPGEVSGEECVLFVDDEAALVDLGATALRRLGYDVVGCTSSLKALTLFRATPQRFDVVITDQTMPQMTGDELAQELRRIRSDTQIILCTGYSHLIDAEKAHTLGIAEFLMKPWQVQALASAIRRVLTAPSSSRGTVQRLGRRRPLGRTG